MSTKIFTIPGTKYKYCFPKQPRVLTPQLKKTLRLEITKKLPSSVIPLHASLVSNGKINLLIGGPSGSGKSALSQALTRYRFKIIGNDFVAIWLEKNNLFAADINLQNINKHKKSHLIRHICFLQPNQSEDVFRVSPQILRSIYARTLPPLEKKFVLKFQKNKLFKDIFDIHFCLGNRQNPNRWANAVVNVINYKPPKNIGIIGMGTIGQDLANLLVGQSWLSSLNLLSMNQNKLKSIILDLKSANPQLKINRLSSPVKMFKNSDLVILCYSQNNPKKVVDTNNERHKKFIAHTEIGSDIVKCLNQSRIFSGTILVVTNPVDTLSWSIYHLSNLSPKSLQLNWGGLQSNQIYGIGLGLDQKRLDTLTNKQFQVVGEHGDQIIFARNKMGKLIAFKNNRLHKLLTKYSNRIRQHTARTRFGPVNEILYVINSLRKNDVNSIVRASTKLNNTFIGQPMNIRNGVPSIHYQYSIKLVNLLNETATEHQKYQKLILGHFKQKIP